MKPFISITIITVAFSLGGAATISGQEIPDGGSLPDVQQGAQKSEAEDQRLQKLQAEYQSTRAAVQKAQADYDQQRGAGGGGGGGATLGGSGAVYTDRL